MSNTILISNIDQRPTITELLKHPFLSLVK